MNEEFSFRDIVELAQDVVIVTKAKPLDHPGPEIVYVNPAFTKLTGFTPEEAIGQTPRILQGMETSQLTTHQIRQSLERKQPIHVAIKDYTKDGREYWLDMSITPLHDETGEVSHFVAIERDVTHQKMLEEKLKHMAEHDPLTGLYNRRKFFESLDSHWDDYRNDGTPFSLISLDLDNFKDVNDQYGHQAGDTVLSHIAHTIQNSCRTSDTVARMGGEEFAVLLGGLDLQAAFDVAERIRKNVAETLIDVGTETIWRTVSLGVSEIHPDDCEPCPLLHRADKALYRSKAAGRNCTNIA